MFNIVLTKKKIIKKNIKKYYIFYKKNDLYMI